MNDLSENIDDYCRKIYGHSNWGYVDTYTEKELKSENHTIEGNIVFWEKDLNLKGLEQDT